ncbi:DUF2812 domain-containing protein [Aquibacillus saliphilus]|uniref:DUF2812 domain-containing protein n=1 Tax=Aquibacillus saliphilus TaxID=1909422 RepID=UPI001CF05EB6|nr:DUF2812 domain-containing protein [Aquibacillus saliphilus]
MVEKVFRPFWSYDLQKTEEWLKTMAKDGFHFVDLNRQTRVFLFEKGEPKVRTYRIGYDNFQPETLSKSMSDEGWERVFNKGKWSFLVNEKPVNQIQLSPVRDGIIKRNGKLVYLFGGIGIYLTFSVLLNVVLLTFSIFFQDTPITIVPSPFWILTPFIFLFGIAVWCLVLYSIFKIIKTNKQLSGEEVSSSVHQEKHERTRKEEKQLKRSGKLIVKKKFGWMYAPDKLEKWLESMEQQGYNLHRVSKIGTIFYFTKGQPRNVSFCADYQNIANESYFSAHKDAGWENIFSSYSSITKWTIWSRKYNEGEEAPKLYTDRTHKLKHARRIAVTNSCMFGPLLVMYVFIISSMITHAIQYGLEQQQLISIVLFGLCIVIFGSFTIRTWFYYIRLKKHSD